MEYCQNGRKQVWPQQRPDDLRWNKSQQYLTKHPCMQNFKDFRSLGAILRNFLWEFAHFAPPLLNLVAQNSSRHCCKDRHQHLKDVLFWKIEYEKDQRFLSSDICLTTFSKRYIMVFNLKSYHILPFSLKAIVMLQDAAL